MRCLKYSLNWCENISVWGPSASQPWVWFVFMNLLLCIRRLKDQRTKQAGHHVLCVYLPLFVCVCVFFSTAGSLCVCVQQEINILSCVVSDFYFFPQHNHPADLDLSSPSLSLCKGCCCYVWHVSLCYFHSWPVQVLTPFPPSPQLWVAGLLQLLHTPLWLTEPSLPLPASLQLKAS